MAFRFSSFGTFGQRLAKCAGFVLAGGSFLAAACGPGASGDYSYYCDSTGCYRCDAYGCSRTSDPTACTTEADCPSDMICQNNQCVTETTLDGGSDAANPDATTPDAAVPDATPPAEDAATCGTTATGPCACDATKPCASGQLCVNGACTDEKNGCKYSSECDDGKVCANSQCVATCDATCADGFTCDKGVCKPSSPDCVTGDCATTCATDPECGAGKYCNQGRCVVDTRPASNCTADSQCGGTPGTPKKCVRGFCKYTCDSDAYCRTIDSRIGTCAADKVCRTADEANAACTASSDCTGGKSCIDNTCK